MARGLRRLVPTVTARNQTVALGRFAEGSFRHDMNSCMEVELQKSVQIAIRLCVHVVVCMGTGECSGRRSLSQVGVRCAWEQRDACPVTGLSVLQASSMV